MSSEPRPNPITNTFNVKDWIPSTSSGNSDFATNATNAVNTNITSTNESGTYFPTFVSNSTGNLPQLVDDSMFYNPSTNTLTVGTLVGAVSGTLTNAVTADNVKVTSSTLNQDYFPTFVTGAGASLPVFTDSHMTYNPGTDTLTVGTLVGTVSGSISNAVTSSNVVVTAPSLNQDHYPTFVSASTGASLPEIADPDLKYNPSTNTLTATNVTVTGTLTATVATATSATTATTATNADKIKVTTGSGATSLSLALVDGITGNVNTLASSALTYTPSTDTLSVGTLTTASNCTIGNSLSTFTVNSGTTNIGNGGLGATDKINIAGGTNATGSELFLGSTTLTRAFLRGVDVNINHQRAGNINVGADTLLSTTNILGTTNIGSTSKVLTINAPMVVGYPTTALTLPTQIGYTVRDTITLSGTIPSNTNRYFFGAGGKVLPAGVWLIQFTTRGRSTGTSTFTRYFTWGEDSVTGTNPLNAMTSLSSTTVIDSEGLSTCGAFTVTSTGTTTYNIVIFFIYTGSPIYADVGEFGSTVKRTRLA